MNIGILGAGNIGGRIAEMWARAGHHVLLSFSRDIRNLTTLAASIGPNAQVGTPADAVKFGDVVLLSVHWDVVNEVLQQAGTLSGKVVIDTSNPFSSDFQGLAIGPDTSAAQEIAKRAPGARVVKAYNTLPSPVLVSNSTQTQARQIALFYCGDDAAAKTVVAGLITDSGFAPIDTGPLRNARDQEPQGPLYNKTLSVQDAQRLVATMNTPL